MIDPKARYTIAGLHSKIQSGDFHETDIALLLIFLREIAYKHKIKEIQEVADFIAHRNKDKGIYKVLRDRFQGALNGINVPADGILGTLISPRVFHAAFNKAFDQVGLSHFSVERTTQIITCIISIFQSATIVSDDPQVPQKLIVAIQYDQFALCCQGTVPPGHIICIPIIVVPNPFEWPKNMTAFSFLPTLVDISCRNGKLHLQHSHESA